MKPLRFIDLFCGIGGFRLAAQEAASSLGFDSKCVLSCDIDPHCQKAYAGNFGEEPTGDISKIDGSSVPDHELLLAGFPCQPFSIIGSKKGFEDTRGTLFFEIARILEAKRPACFVLENVRMLARHDKGRTLSVIKDVLKRLGYSVHAKVLNALDFGLPQKRERIFIVGFRDFKGKFEWPPGGVPMAPLESILEKDVDKKFFASSPIRRKRRERLPEAPHPSIWHENKSGNVCAHSYSCALRAGASHNYLLVDGERRLTPREMLRLQGFPDSFKIVCGDWRTSKQAGNSLPAPVAKAVIEGALKAAFPKP